MRCAAYSVNQTPEKQADREALLARFRTEQDEAREENPREFTANQTLEKQADRGACGSCEEAYFAYVPEQTRKRDNEMRRLSGV